MDYKLNNIEIGERIRSIRENMLMSREKFSEMVDISEVFLGQIERGECSLSLKTLTSIIAHTGYSSDFILYGNDDSNTYILGSTNSVHCGGAPYALTDLLIYLLYSSDILLLVI